MTKMTMLRNPNRSAARASDILLGFINYDEVGVTELSQSLNLAKSTVHSLLQTLKNKGLIEQNLDNSKYRLGVKVFQLGMRWVRAREVRTVARPYMQQLSEELGMRVHLSILAGDQALIADKVEPFTSFLVVPGVGWTMPLHSTASGKVLLAYSPSEVVNRVSQEKGLIRYTTNTITDPVNLDKVLDKVRLVGYAFDEEETLSGVMCIAAPIRDYTNSVIASVSACGSVEQFPPRGLEDLITRVKNCANMISTSLGYQLAFVQAIDKTSY
jgi:DNA-binding IclR family transcriptional regulator